MNERFRFFTLHKYNLWLYIYIDADGDTVRVYGLDCSGVKKFDTVTADVQIMNGQNGLYVRVPKN